MKNPKIMAAVNSINGAKNLVRAGADEFFMGLDVQGKLKRISFTGRGRMGFNDVRSHLCISDFKEVIAIAHDNNIKVDIVANAPFMVESSHKGNEFESMFLEYIEQGIKCGIDGVILGDLGTILLVSEKGYNISLHASTMMGTFTVDDALFLKELGISRVILPHHSALEDIQEIAEIEGLECEIFGFFGCSNIEGVGCHFKHYSGEKVDLGLPCRSLFHIKPALEGTQPLPILDSAMDCPLCNMDKVIETGVDIIKIFGRSKEKADLVVALVTICKEVIKRIQEDEPIKEIATSIKTRFPWIVPFFCCQGRCKYNSNMRRTRSFI